MSYHVILLSCLYVGGDGDVLCCDMLGYGCG